LLQSGEVTLAPALLQGGNASGNLSFTPVTWRATVYQPPVSASQASRTELSLWFDTHGANYTNNFALGWDACYFWMLPFLPNTFFRGQNDPGDCSSTLDTSCIADLKNATESASHELLFILPNSGPYSSLNATSLPGVCNQIASMVNVNFPSSCAPFFNGTGSLVAGSPYIGGGMSTS
jgi:hypothetical protein